MTPETIELLGSTKSKIKKDKNSENVPYLEITEVVLIHCNDVNNSYQPSSRVSYTSVPNKSFDLLGNPNRFLNFLVNFTFLKFFDSEFSFTEVCLQIKILIL